MIFPIDPEIDDPDFVYRFQTRETLRHMRSNVGDYLTGSLWEKGVDCPHQHYLKLNKLLPKDQGIYTLSVWRNEPFARYELRNCTSGQKDYILLRISRSVLEDSGLTAIDDDFLTGKALLLYEIALRQEDRIYGDARIPWTGMMQIGAVWEKIKIESELLKAVTNSYAPDYIIWDLENDYGLPFDEKVLRAHLRHLTRLAEVLECTKGWRFIQRREAASAFNAAKSLWRDLDRTGPGMRAAIHRLRSRLPSHHPWNKYL